MGASWALQFPESNRTGATTPVPAPTLLAHVVRAVVAQQLVGTHL